MRIFSLINCCTVNKKKVCEKTRAHFTSYHKQHAQQHLINNIDVNYGKYIRFTIFIYIALNEYKTLHYFYMLLHEITRYFSSIYKY